MIQKCEIEQTHWPKYRISVWKHFTIQIMRMLAIYRTNNQTRFKEFEALLEARVYLEEHSEEGSLLPICVYDHQGRKMLWSNEDVEEERQHMRLNEVLQLLATA